MIGNLFFFFFIAAVANWHVLTTFLGIKENNGLLKLHLIIMRCILGFKLIAFHLGISLIKNILSSYLFMNKGYSVSVKKHIYLS